MGRWIADAERQPGKTFSEKPVHCRWRRQERQQAHLLDRRLHGRRQPSTSSGNPVGVRLLVPLPPLDRLKLSLRPPALLLVVVSVVSALLPSARAPSTELAFAARKSTRRRRMAAERAERACAGDAKEARLTATSVRTHPKPKRGRSSSLACASDAGGSASAAARVAAADGAAAWKERVASVPARAPCSRVATSPRHSTVPAPPGTPAAMAADGRRGPG